jgi:outer membrane protein assembly factor BamD
MISDKTQAKQIFFGYVLRHIGKSVYILVVYVLINMLSACGNSYGVSDIRDAESAYKSAMAAFTDENYFEAQRIFDLIRLQYPTTQYADDAQYYLGEISFRRKEFIMAAFNYGMVRRSYPASELNKPALFKTAMSYYELAPPADRDQEYTRKAIGSFSEFQAIYPNDSLATEAGNKIMELRNRLAERELLTAQLYRKLYANKSALIYYETIIDEYPDTEHYETAFVGKIEVLGLLKRPEEARAAIELYRKRFNRGKLTAEVDDLEKKLPAR